MLISCVGIIYVLIALLDMIIQYCVKMSIKWFLILEISIVFVVKNSMSKLNLHTVTHVIKTIVKNAFLQKRDLMKILKEYLRVESSQKKNLMRICLNARMDTFLRSLKKIGNGNVMIVM